MDSKMQTGLLLVLGPIISALGWFAFYPADGSEGAQAMATDLMGDPEVAKVGILLGFGGMIATLMGLINISRKMLMTGGAGASYANIATFLNMALIALLLTGTGLELGVTEATSAQGGVTLMGVSKAVGDPLSIPLGIALILIGVAIAREKSFHVAVAAFGVVVGALLVISVPGLIFESGSDIAQAVQIAGWMGFMLNSIVLGVSRLRAD